MAKGFTLSEMADRIAALDGRDATRVHAQLRNPSIKQLLQPIAADRGKTTAVTFSAVEVIRARLATVLIDIGHDAATVASALAPLDRTVRPGFRGDEIIYPESFKVPDQASLHGLSGLDAAVRGVRSHDEEWELRIQFTRPHGGDREVRAHLAVASWDRDDAQAREMLADSYGCTHLGDLTIPLNPLIAPLLSEIATED